MNDHNFSRDFVSRIYAAASAAGIDYMEVGYKGAARLYSRDTFGTWKFCTEDDMRAAIAEKNGTRISVMADAERTDYHTDILPRDRSVVDMVRVATYIHQIPAALDILHDAADKGYETCLNIMAVSTVPEWELDRALEAIVQTPVKALYVVDSFGTLYAEHVRALVRRFQRFTKPAGKEVGIHTHNNLQLAFANTIEAIALGASYVDGSIAGLGRGAGNCPMELILSYLNHTRFTLRPVLEAIQETVEPMRAELRWGFAIPYMLTGSLNQHPRSAMSFMEGDTSRDIVRFYDSMVLEPVATA